MVKYCPNCGTKVETKFCPECGTDLNQVVGHVEECKEEVPAVEEITGELGIEDKEEATDTVKSKEAPVKEAVVNGSKKSKKKKILAIVGIIVVLLLLLAMCSGGDETTTSSDESTSTTEYTEEYTEAYTEETTEEYTEEPTEAEEFDPDNYIERAYDKLARYPDDYMYEQITNDGEVVQVIEGDEDVQLRVAVNGDYDTIIFLEYSKDIIDTRILEDDYITFYGTSLGIITYESTMGGDISIPAALVDHIEINY